ncbi:helix-turn-helix transcriptional regulator [Plantactinospora sp. KLBMP9567]|uniref:helix-turn-helix transcriptional regulator n=1 Tax=Plantactinospora sp. KLBMP9567 TaxID=3085900 RepID=UPI002980BCA6|nr:LuxR C-terminal-related transcriptional regulator [Plantactinospora sp. KLBMP9567]MDW5328816.1 LuxR C-terminal-related transcriptional regulator [Plantactinospora sp. KLBMP9567]
MGDEVTPMVGRAAELELLDRALSMVAAGRFTGVEISGGLGVGKTRLLSELRQRAAAAGLSTCSGRAVEVEQSRPYGLFAEALGPLGWRAPEKADRLDVYYGVHRLLGGVLLLDDLHWADPASLQLTEHLIRRPPPRPLLIAVTFRHTRPPVRVVDALVGHGPAAIRIGLARLGPNDLESLLPDLPHRRRELILRASGGSPGLVRALCRLSDDALAALLSGGDHDGDRAIGGTARDVLAGLAAEIVAQDPDTRAVAQAAAVAGDQATVDLLAHVTGLTVTAVTSAVDRLCWLGHVEVYGTRFGFPNPVLRAAVRALVGPATRVGLHARVAGYLRTHGGPLRALAHHTERSAGPGDETAARTLVDAGLSCVFSAPAQSGRWLAAALRVLPEGDPRRPTVTLRYARALALTGDLNRPQAVLTDLPDDPAELPDEAGTRVGDVRALVAQLRGDADEAAAILRELLRRNPPGTAAAEVGRRVRLAAAEALRSAPGATRIHAERALAGAGNDRSVLAGMAHGLSAVAALSEGRIAAARIHLASATDLVDAAADESLWPHLDLLGTVSWAAADLGDLAAAGRHLARARELAEDTGQRGVLPYLLVLEAALHTRAGRLVAALRLAREAGTAARRAGSAELAAMADAVLLRPLLWTAGPGATAAVARRLADADRPRTAAWRRIAGLNLAVAALAAGHPQECLDRLAIGPSPSQTLANAWTAAPANVTAAAPANAPPDAPPRATAAPPAHASPSVEAPAAMQAEALRAVALAGTGDLGAARMAAERAQLTAAGAGLPYELGLAGYARASIAVRAGRSGEAARLARGAAADLATAGAPFDAALAEHLAGRAHGRAGHVEWGRAAFDRALGGYRECGAGWLAAVAVAERDRPARTLTAREREIAGLVAMGLTNQEIAARLFLSRRTVESHLSRMFAKLDVRSRTGLINRLRAA